MNWNNQGGNRGPWGNRNKGSNDPAQNGAEPPRPAAGDAGIDEALRAAQDRLQSFFGGGNKSTQGGAQNPPNILPLILLVIAAIWLGSGFYRVLPEEHAVILTFGKWTDTRVEPGLGYAIPWPVQRVEKVNVTFERRVEIGFRDSTARNSAISSDIPGESLMLTGDENIIDIDFVVLWRISDAGKYLFEIRDPESTVKKVAESAMREIIGRTQIQPALTEARDQIEVQTRALMQLMLDEYNSGIAINGVQLQKVDPPTQVVDAFIDVQRARADRERLRNEAEAYRNDIIPKARGDAERLLQDAGGYKAAIINRAQGDADRFVSVYKAYTEAKDVTLQRMYLETLQEIMQSSAKVIVSPSGGAPILPYLPLDKIKKQGSPAQ